jgi:hypothetical protein
LALEFCALLSSEHPARETGESNDKRRAHELERRPASSQTDFGVWTWSATAPRNLLMQLARVRTAGAAPTAQFRGRRAAAAGRLAPAPAVSRALPRCAFRSGAAPLGGAAARPASSSAPAAAAAARRRRARGAAPAAPRAMVNVDVSPSVVLGVGLIGAGVSLWQIRQARPWISKDYDVVVSCISLLVGGILIFQGWRLDPLLLFGQLMTTAAGLSFAVEALRLRSELYDVEERAELENAARRRGPGGPGGTGAAFQLPPPEAGAAPPRWGGGAEYADEAPGFYDYGAAEEAPPPPAYSAAAAGERSYYDGGAAPAGPPYFEANYYDAAAGGEGFYYEDDDAAGGAAEEGGGGEVQFPPRGDSAGGGGAPLRPYDDSEDWV